MTLSFHVPDMTCGHCVQAITAAVQAAAPGATVRADLGSHTVEVAGAGQAETVAAAIAAAGYTARPA